MMIKSNELRIGNIIQSGFFSDGSGPITWTIEEGEEIDYYCNIPESVGIALTPEWLERLGFKFLDSIINGRYFVAWANSNSEIAWYPVGEYVSVNTSTGGDGEPPNYTESPLPHVKYVHQLQNLYFALTGEELTTKE